MKTLIAVMISLFTVSSFAAGISETVRNIEMDKNVKCTLIKSGFAFCVGTPRELSTCRYTQTYACYGQDAFTLKIKVKEYYSVRTDSRETKVTKVSVE